MALVTRFVNLASTAGGDGTTNATSGSTRAYASANEWESNEQTNLVSAGDTHEVICEGGTDSTAFDVNGWTTSATNFVTIKTTVDDPGGILDATKYNLNPGTGTARINVFSDNVDWEKIQFVRDGSSASGTRRALSIDFQSGGNSHNITDCIFVSVAAVSANPTVGIYVDDSGTILTVKNTLIYDFDDTPDIGIDINAQGSGGEDIINCVIQNCTIGIEGLANTKIVNTVFQDNTTDINGTVDTVNSGNNLSDSATSLPGSNNVQSSTLTFEDKANDDFHLVSGDTDAIGAGIGPASDSDVLTTDVDGDTRSGTTCDIGFDEFVSTGDTLAADSGSYTYTGTAAELQRGLIIAADSGSYSYTGTNVDFLISMAADSGAYVYTGTEATLTFTPIGSFTLTADSGTYTYAGTAVDFQVGRVLVAESGAYTYSGTDAALQRGLVLIADSGSYTYSGTTVDLNHGFNIAADSGSYAYTGTNIDLLLGSVLVAESGSYTYTGTNADLQKGSVLVADSGSYAYSGTNVDFVLGFNLAADSGSYAYTGTNAGLIFDRVLNAQSGSYTYTGASVTFQASGRVWTVQAGATTAWDEQADSTTTWTVQ